MPLKIEKYFQQRIIYQPGIYQTIITAILEVQKFNSFTHADEDLIEVQFTITSGELRDKIIFARVTPRLSPSSSLWKLCAAAHNGRLTPQDLAPIQTVADISSFLLNLPVQVLVKNQVSRTGTTYYKIVDYIAASPTQPMTIPSSMAPPVQEDKKVEQPNIPTEQPIVQNEVEKVQTSDPTDNWLDEIPTAKPE